MKKYAVMFCAMLAMGALTVSCSSEDEAVGSNVLRDAGDGCTHSILLFGG